MKDIHVSFNLLSDLCDNSLMSADEREKILHHITTCPICRLEYDCLKRTLCLLSELHHREYKCPGLSIRTIAAIKSRRRRRMIYRVGPSVAATVAIIVGASLFRMDATHSPDRVYSGMLKTEAPRVATDTEEIVRCISGNRGRILAISEFYVEGEVSPERFDSLRKQLGFRKMEYSLVAVSPGNVAGSRQGTGNMEVVSAGDRRSFHTEGSPSGNRKMAVRFRVFR